MSVNHAYQCYVSNIIHVSINEEVNYGFNEAVNIEGLLVVFCHFESAALIQLPFSGYGRGERGGCVGVGWSGVGGG